MRQFQDSNEVIWLSYPDDNDDVDQVVVEMKSSRKDTNMIAVLRAESMPLWLLDYGRWLGEKTSNFNTQVGGDAFLLNPLQKKWSVFEDRKCWNRRGDTEFSLACDEFKLPMEYTNRYGQVAGHVSCTYGKNSELELFDWILSVGKELKPCKDLKWFREKFVDRRKSPGVNLLKHKHFRDKQREKKTCRQDRESSNSVGRRQTRCLMSQNPREERLSRKSSIQGCQVL